MIIDNIYEVLTILIVAAYLSRASKTVSFIEAFGLKLIKKLLDKKLK